MILRAKHTEKETLIIRQRPTTSISHPLTEINIMLSLNILSVAASVNIHRVLSWLPLSLDMVSKANPMVILKVGLL